MNDQTFEGPRFLVTWTIDIEGAATAEEAAAQAQACQQRPGTTATVFDVLDRMTGQTRTVDLMEAHEPVELVLVSHALRRVEVRAS